MTSDRRAYIRPSGAAVWTRCAVYPHACATYPALPESPDEVRVREEGTACHWLAEHLYRQRALLPVGTVAPNGIVIDGEMQKAARMFVRSTAMPQEGVEERLNCGLILAGMEGSPDYWGYNHAANTLYVDDLKYGFGFVEVYRNLQLSIYALVLGARLTLRDDTKVVLRIVQPRAITNEGPDRKWETTLGWLRENMLGFLQMAAVLALHGDIATAGLHCLDCPGRFTCSTFINTASEVCRHASKAVPMELSPVSLGAELRVVKDMRKLLEGREESLKAQVESLMRNGKSVPGWEFKPSKGREAFIPGTEQAAIGAAKLYGVEATRPISPGEFRKKLPAVVADTFLERPKAGLALTYVGDREVEKSFNK